MDRLALNNTDSTLSPEELLVNAMFASGGHDMLDPEDKKRLIQAISEMAIAAGRGNVATPPPTGAGRRLRPPVMRRIPSTKQEIEERKTTSRLVHKAHGWPDLPFAGPGSEEEDVEHQLLDLPPFLSFFSSNQGGPRPEMYPHDIEHLKEFSKEHPGSVRDNALRHVRAACESGWDFSSRWHVASARSFWEELKNTPEGQVVEPRVTMPSYMHVETRRFLAVDLNALLYSLELFMAELTVQLQSYPEGLEIIKAERNLWKTRRREQLDAVEEWRNKHPEIKTEAPTVVLPPVSAGAWSMLAAKRMKAMRAAMIDKPSHLVFDYILNDNPEPHPGAALLTQFTPVVLGNDVPVRNRGLPSLAAAFGLAVGLGETHAANERYLRRLLKVLHFYMDSDDQTLMPRTTPCYKTREQWDGDLTWPPLIHTVVVSLGALPPAEQSGSRMPEGGFFSLHNRSYPIGIPSTNAAANLSKIYVNSIRKGIHEMGHIWEKSKRDGGVPHQRGEYEVQDGFGWTCGVGLDFLKRKIEN